MGPSLNRPRVVLLCRDDLPSRAVSNLLDSEFNLAAVLVESVPSRKKMLQRRARRLGWVTVLGQLAFIALSRITAPRYRERISEILSQHNLNGELFALGKVRKVNSVNDEETRVLLRELEPDVVVVNGTRIIGAPTLQCVSAPFVNTHAGVTPRYRGVHGGYWALAREDRAHCGVTVHLVDEGIDTGTVLAQHLIEPTPQDSFHTYPILQLAAAAPSLVRCVQELADGTVSPTAGVGPSELFYHPTLWGYLWTRWRKGVR